MATPTDLRSRVDAFVADLNDLIRKSALDAVHSALGMSSKPRSSRARSTAKAKPADKRLKRDPQAVLTVADRVHAAIKAQPGQSVEQIGKAVKLATKDLVLPIRKLVEAQRVKTKGQRRGTKYFVA